MQSNERAKANSQEAIEKRREKERKREEKELRKAAKAAGVKLSTVTPLVPAPTPGAELALSERKSGFSAGGWSTVGSLSSGTGFKKAEWTAVSSSHKPPSPPPPPLPSELSHLVPNPPLPASGFRSGGWTTLEGLPSASTPNRPLTPNVDHPPPPPPEQAPTLNPSEPSITGFKPIPVAKNPVQIQPQPASRPAKNPSVGQRAESSRSGWQSFSRGGSKR